MVVIRKALVRQIVDVEDPTPALATRTLFHELVHVDHLAFALLMPIWQAALSGGTLPALAD